MVANSDNHATLLLQDNINFTSFKNTITDLGFDEHKLIDTNYKFKAREYSIFLEALYNAGYLNITSSEYASSLLAQCKFKDGILKELPADVKAIHKFGEYAANDDKELHESAIIYINNNAYLITIMTKGHDFSKLSDLMGHLSKMVYDYMNTNA
jgi:beta-lactamase class A